MEESNNETLITLTSDIVAAHVSNNNVQLEDLPALISSVFGALEGLGKPAVVVDVLPEPAVSIRASVKPDHIVCLEDGKKLKMRKRRKRLSTKKEMLIFELQEVKLSLKPLKFLNFQKQLK